MSPDGRIRVLQLGNPVELYGAERWIVTLIKHLDKGSVESEIAVILDAPRLKADLCKEAERIGVPAIVFRAYGRVNWSAVEQLRTYILENSVDILHTHGYKTDIVGLLATRGTRCRTVTTPHGWSTNAGLKLKVYESLDRLAFWFFDAVAPLSEDLACGLKRMPFLGRKLRFIPNGVDLSDVGQANEPAAEVKEWRDYGYFVIGYVGQLIRRKGVDVLLRAMSGVERRNWRLAIVGDGDAKEELWRLTIECGLEKQVKFFGYRNDRLTFLKGFDAFVLPSWLEGVPRCLMEAMACNVPVIASNIPGCRDLVRDGRTGLLFTPGSVEELRDRLKLLMANRALRSGMARSARRLIEKQWSAAVMAGEYLRLYKQLLSMQMRASHR